MPLNFQLSARCGTLLKATKTAPNYKLYALKNTAPPKPGLQYASKGGQAIDVEVWEIPFANFGHVVAEVPSPLGIGNVQLADGSWVKGFICEGYALEGAVEISHFGGWRAYIQSIQSTNTKYKCSGIGEIAS